MKVPIGKLNIQYRVVITHRNAVHDLIVCLTELRAALGVRGGVEKGI